jgi:hypothetical protein
MAKINKTAKTKFGKQAQPSALKGALKQTEGYTPKQARSKGKPAGMLGGAKAREKRLEKVPM